jgi:enoyl-CoA hydratase
MVDGSKEGDGAVTSHLRASFDDDLLEITIDNPPVNVMTAGSWDHLGELLDQAQAAGVSGILIGGAGQRAFCAGSNIDEMLDLDGVSGPAWSRRNYAIRERLRTFPRPVVAALHGDVLGGGLALAVSCDIRVADATAQFGLPEARVGLVGTANALLQYLPPGKVKELVFTGRRISAIEAREWGLVEQVVDAGGARDAARQLLREAAAMSPLAIRLYKSTVNHGMELGLSASLALELERLEECWASTERREWVQRYIDRRAARRSAAHSQPS